MTNRTCVIEGCEGAVRARDWCTRHYQRWQKHGDPGGVEVRSWGRQGCDVDDCERPHYGHGYCNTHLSRLRRNGTLDVVPRVRATCSFGDCGRPAVSLGHCNGHAIQRRQGRPLRPIQERRSSTVRDERGRKECGICREWKAEAEFYGNVRHVDGLSTYCRRCDRGVGMARRYGITLDDYTDLLDAQGGGCGICGHTPEDPLSLAVDHDHACCSGRKACGKCVRGLLCADCNRVLGMFDDDVSRFERAITYLRSAGGGP
ncbi:endonuclease VII domain-containing protein [Streptomyces salinarius]|uniref:endonuclease VII domain-containing protein n=1 Tax=Streptomyces salinarius TaxID=2762598 RepID=UPI002852A757|nr:endonuclease VII domain-containing protein [Streptomyces salinarius]